MNSPEPAGPLTFTTGRVEAFSDGVIAVVATLLVLELKEPEAGLSLWPFLRDQLPTLAAYVISFLTILIFWVNHHALFNALERVDRYLLFANGILLLGISFVSYSTAILSHSLQEGEGDAPAAVFYAVVLGATSACFTAIWAYLARHPGLVVPPARSRIRPAILRSLMGPALYLVAAVVALLSAPVSVAVAAGAAIYFTVLPGHLRRVVLTERAS